MVGKRMQRGGQRNFGRGSGGGGGGGGYYRSNVSYQTQNQSVPSPWQTNRNSQQLNDMELELEMVKRKRQMLQEQRQLLEEQRQLQRLQDHQSSQAWETPRPYQNQQNFTDDSMAYTEYYQPERRAPKRPAAQPNWQPSRKAPKIRAPNNRPKSTKHDQSIQLEIEQDVGPVDPPVSKKNPNTNDEVFRGPEKMSPWARGRLEFCVGRLFQEVRLKYTQPPYNDLNPTQLKAAKEKVRQRLHKIMMNKAILGSDEMMAMYRKVHPMSGEIKLLTEILKIDTPKKELSKEAKASPRASADTKPNKTKVERKKLTPDQVAIHKAANSYMYKMLDSKLNDIFTRVYEICSKEDLSAEPLKDEPTKTESNQPEVVDNAPAKLDVSAETSDTSKPANSVAAENGNVDAEAAGEEKVKPEVKAESEKGPENELDQIVQPIVNRIFKLKLRSILPNYKELLLAIISRDPRMQELGMKVVAEKPEIVEKHTYKQLYFVKIMGRPMLPPRPAMQEFLAQYEVAAIKKHRSIYNLLFVGVGSEEAREKLLECNGQSLNGKVLDIRKSEKNKNPKANGTTATEGEASQKEAEAGMESKEEKKETEKSENVSSAISEFDTEIKELMTYINESDKNDDDKVEVVTQSSEVVTIEDDGEVQLLEESKSPEKDSTEQPAGAAEEDQPGGIRTRRSSRLPQKN